jgi:hypothetical protein
VIRESPVAEIPSSIRYESKKVVTSLLLKEGSEVQDTFGGIGFLFQEGDADEPGVLVNKGEEVTASRVGGGSDWSNKVCVNGLEGVSGAIKMASEGNSRDLAFHA